MQTSTANLIPCPKETMTATRLKGPLYHFLHPITLLLILWCAPHPLAFKYSIPHIQISIQPSIICQSEERAIFPHLSKAYMATEQIKAQVTELFVRMDCNGCVQRIKRALHNLDVIPLGIYEVYIDVAHQKLTVVGRVEPEKIVKAIKKTRKIAAICTPAEASTEPSSSETPPAKHAANSNAPSTESTDQVPTKAIPPTDPPKDAPPTENPAQDVKPLPESNEATPSKPKDAEEIHMVHYYQLNDSYREHWNVNPRAHEIRYEASPHYVIHSYNNYRQSPSMLEYMNIRAAPQRSEIYREGNYHNQQSGDGSQITSMFSEENPNACMIA